MLCVFYKNKSVRISVVSSKLLVAIEEQGEDFPQPKVCLTDAVAFCRDAIEGCMQRANISSSLFFLLLISTITSKWQNQAGAGRPGSHSCHPFRSVAEKDPHQSGEGWAGLWEGDSGDIQLRFCGHSGGKSRMYLKLWIQRVTGHKLRLFKENQSWKRMKNRLPM